MANSTRATSLYPPPVNKPYASQSETTYYHTPSDNATPTEQVIRSLSPEDVQKLKYKIELDKQVAEKQQRLAREWEKKIERDRKYVQHQPFGRHDRTTVLNPKELEEILTKGRAPSPVIDMPQQYPLHQQQQQQHSARALGQQPGAPYNNSNNNTPTNMYAPSHQASLNTLPQNSNYSKGSAAPPPPTVQTSNSFSNPDFQRFYGPGNTSNANGGSSQSSTTSQPIKGDAHDPFSLYDPNKETQNVFNMIPQQDLYDPWGRPGAGAPLIHAPTGQKFTRYSGSLEDKLNTTGPLGFHRRQFVEDINEQKRDLELEQRRRHQEELEFRSNAGNTAEWITQLEGNRYPLKMHLPTTETTREITGARTRFRSDDSRILHDDLIRQAEERARLHKLSRYQENIAELHHSQAMNNWWGKSGGGAPTYTRRRHDVHNSFENPRQKWTTNHLGQLIVADEEISNPIQVQQADFLYAKSKQLSNHRNYYQMADDQAS